MIKKLIVQLKDVFKNTFSIHQKTTSAECFLSWIFQLIISMIVIILGFIEITLDLGLYITIPLYSLLTYLYLSLPSFMSLIVRRFNDMNMNVIYVWLMLFGYLSQTILMFLGYQELMYPFIGTIIFLLTHIYITMLILMPSVQN